MKLYRTMSALFLLLFLSDAVNSQALPKTLLWRISGHGLRQPSYLFGTMHLNDKRLFAFGDSVYHAIEQSAGLAIEVNPDEMGAYLVNKLFDQMEKGKKLQQLLKDSDFKKYSDALEKKFKKPAADITANDVVKEKNKWMSEYMEKGEMPTFVDAYLYNIARRQGKWLGGIEDITDQAGLMEDMVDKSDIDYLLAGDSQTKEFAINTGVDRMVKLYIDQDIEGIEAFSSESSTPGKKDKLLIKRNLKMARRIDSLANLRNMFLAVGAAHLPGDSGIIYLLRERGFTVEPVFSSKKIEQKDYTFKEVAIPWVPVADGQGWYQTSMPGNPATVKLFGVVEMKFLMDIFNMASYCTMAVLNPGDKIEKDSLYKNLSMRMMQTDKPLPFTVINNDGIEGREYKQLKKGTNLRLQLFLYNKVLYVSFLGTTKPAQLESEDAGKFFASLKINKNAAVAGKGSVFTDSVMGIRFESPAALSYNQKLSNNNDAGWKISTFSGSDIASGSYIMVFSKDVKPGHFIPSDTAVKNDFNRNMLTQYSDIHHEEKWIQGYKAELLTGRNIVQPSFYMSSINVVKNGRNIVLLAIADSANHHSASINRIFDSFRFIDQPVQDWKIRYTDGNRFSARTPAPLVSSLSSTNGNQLFVSYDTSTATSYTIIPDTLSKYYWAKTDSSFWKAIVTANTGEDSLIQQAYVKNGEIKGVELLTRERSSITHFKRMRILQQGEQLYKLFSSAEKDFLYSPNTDSFFSSFRPAPRQVNANFITAPKTDTLLADLLNTDSASRRNAFDALDAAPFTETERGPLQQALFRQYHSPYDTTINTDINYSLLKKMVPLDTNASIDFIKKTYTALPATADTSRNIALSLLAKLHTKDSYAAIAEMLRQHTPRQPFSYVFRGDIRDSLPLTLSIYPVLQQLAADTFHAANVANIVNELLDSNLLQLNQVKPAENDFVLAANQLLPALLQKDDFAYDVYELLIMLGRFNSAAANKTLRSYLAVTSPWLKKRAALELADNNQPVPPAVFSALAADKSVRSTLYNDLTAIHRENLFPAKYHTQAAFAETDLYNTAGDEDEYLAIDSMVLIGTKTAAYQKKNYVFYLYRMYITAEDGPVQYLGIAGGYTPGKLALEPAVTLHGIYKTKPFDAKNTGQWLTAYLKEIAESEAAAAQEQAQ